MKQTPDIHPQRFLQQQMGSDVLFWTAVSFCMQLCHELLLSVLLKVDPRTLIWDDRACSCSEEPQNSSVTSLTIPRLWCDLTQSLLDGSEWSWIPTQSVDYSHFHLRTLHYVLSIFSISNQYIVNKTCTNKEQQESERVGEWAQVSGCERASESEWETVIKSVRMNGWKCVRENESEQVSEHEREWARERLSEWDRLSDWEWASEWAREWEQVSESEWVSAAIKKVSKSFVFGHFAFCVQI